MKRTEDLKIIARRSLNREHFTLELESPHELPQILPGQFAQVRVDGAEGVFLRRPVSIHDVDPARHTVTFLIKVVGPGTARLSRMEAGEMLNVLYPLGNGFNTGVSGPVLLVGGGCGAAPLLYLARHFHAAGIPQQILLGARSKDDLMETGLFGQLGDLHLTTDDGSCGQQGFVTRHAMWDQLSGVSMIYCCGPEPMMKAVARQAARLNIPCQVSLENTMACGIGACLCCVAETVRGNECTCTHGPVFNANELKWQI